MSRPIAGDALSWALDALTLIANLFADPGKGSTPAIAVHQPSTSTSHEQDAPEKKQ
ncbi:hypothetical protein [uncultured Variovorax sp.]|jgi:hypothetical protein|uniref:hypothetical protein n=1 Tax=uncultured Variovorax sp. TaxID=114708 RepID=UPI002612ADDF|nr:hypothetical protein [uncultured Variovorax sp.]